MPVLAATAGAGAHVFLLSAASDCVESVSEFYSVSVHLLVFLTLSLDCGFCLSTSPNDTCEPQRRPQIVSGSREMRDALLRSVHTYARKCSVC
jgi:hypothetical protein